jgi:hypothetical protein
MGTPGFYVAVYNEGVKQNGGVLEDTLMSEKEARELLIRAPMRNKPGVRRLAPNLKGPCGECYTARKGETECLGRREAGYETSSRGGRRYASQRNLRER